MQRFPFGTAGLAGLFRGPWPRASFSKLVSPLSSDKTPRPGPATPEDPLFDGHSRDTADRGEPQDGKDPATHGPAPTTTHFGFQKVPVHDKEKLVGEVFRDVAEHYDQMNDVMSLGIHRLWKDHLMDRLQPRPDTQLLDMAGGTGDIAFRFLQKTEEALQPPVVANPLLLRHHKNNPAVARDQPASVTVVDINPAMLRAGQQRAQRLLTRAQQQRLVWLEGNAEALAPQIASDSFDAYTIAFGIRNCTHLDRVLQEAYRVLRPGGVFLCMEFMPTVQVPLVGPLYDLYSFHMIPGLGALVTGQRAAYQYFVESIRRFPSQEPFAVMLEHAGFQQVRYENLAFGIAAIHSGIKL